MPFAALAKIAAPLVRTAAAKVLPKVIPQVRTVAAGIGKALGVTGAVGGTVAGGYTAGQAIGDYVFAPTPTPMTNAAQSIDYTPWTQPAGAMTVARGPIARPGGAPPAARAPGGMAGGAYQAGMTAGRAVRGLIDQFGRRWSARRVAALTRRIGVEAAAAALGVAAVAVVQMVAQDSMQAVRRRRRGISYAQLNTTRKTLRRFEAMNRYLCKPTTRRKAACR